MKCYPLHIKRSLWTSRMVLAVFTSRIVILCRYLTVIFSLLSSGQFLWPLSIIQLLFRILIEKKLKMLCLLKTGGTILDSIQAWSTLKVFRAVVPASKGKCFKRIKKYNRNMNKKFRVNEAKDIMRIIAGENSWVFDIKDKE